MAASTRASHGRKYSADQRAERSNSRGDRPRGHGSCGPYRAPLGHGTINPGSYRRQYVITDG